MEGLSRYPIRAKEFLYTKTPGKFEKNGLISRHTCDNDNRNIEIRLTEKGFSVVHELNNRANTQIETLISKLDDDELDKLISGIRTVKKYFSKATKNIKI